MEEWLSSKREMSIGIRSTRNSTEGNLLGTTGQVFRSRARASKVAVERSELPQISCAVEPPAVVGVPADRDRRGSRGPIATSGPSGRGWRPGGGRTRARPEHNDSPHRRSAVQAAVDLSESPTAHLSVVLLCQ